MKSKLVLKAFLFLGCSIIWPAQAMNCNVAGKIDQIITSIGDTAIRINAGTGCNCAHSSGALTMAWIDPATNEGRTMVSTALTAKATNANVFVTIQDGLGQGTSGNDSIAYRYWLSCKVFAIQMD